jgi:cyanophycinase
MVFARTCLHYTSLALFISLPVLSLTGTDYDNSPTLGPAKGWLIIHGGGQVTNEAKERFVALAGGPDANFVVIPTALGKEVDADQYRLQTSHLFQVKHVAVLNTTDRIRANSEGFVEPLRHASGVWIDGGRQFRLADAYLGTAVEREIKALLARGGVVFGGSAGATIQGSFLVRGAPSSDNTIMMSPGHEVGFGLLRNSAIDQHVNTRGREGDLDPVIAKHPELLGIGIDQAAAIVVHGDSFFVFGGQVAIHDGRNHSDGASYYFLPSGQAYDLKNRSVEPQDELPLTLALTSATRNGTGSKAITTGTGVLESRQRSESQHINYECGVNLYSIGNVYRARPDGPHRLQVQAREINTDRLGSYTCKIK